MYKFKIFLLILIIPIAVTLYYFTSFEHGLNALIEKKKHLSLLKNNQYELIQRIKKIKHYNSLLNSDSPNLDFLEEKSIEILGKSKKDQYHIKL